MADRELPPILRNSHRLLRRGGVRLLVRRDWEAALPVERLLDGAPLSAWGTPVPHALAGRGPMHVLATPRGEIVAKQLRRGGLAGGVLHRHFLDPLRPVREAAAAEELAARGVATPPVVAARATRDGPLWTLEIATARLPAAGDLLLVLSAGAPAPGLARSVGRALRAAHDAGLRHRDLQVKNVLVPAAAGGVIALLDLDRCTVGEPLRESERIAGLVRFARSLAKHGLLARPGARGAIREFMRGYGGLPDLRPSLLLRRVAGRTARSVALHRAAWR